MGRWPLMLGRGGMGHTQDTRHNNILVTMWYRVHNLGTIYLCRFLILLTLHIQTHFKGNKTLRQVLIKPKDQDPKEKKSEVIYSYQCGTINCGEEYIGETSRTLEECYREHLKEPSPIHVHSLHRGHQLSPDQFNIIGREDQDLSRLIKKSIYIRVNNPTLNRNKGKFNLSHIWNRVLFSTPDLRTAFP